MATKIINGETCTKIGKGEFCIAYRSTENPATVYLITSEGDNVKEILKHCEGDHIPTMQYVDEYETRGTTYTVWKTEYSNRLTKEHSQAWELAKILRKTWDACYTYTRNKDQWYELCYNFIEALRDDDRVPETIVHDLDVIYSWATAFGPNFLFEFPSRNLGVKDDGTLVLRDIVYFR